MGVCNILFEIWESFYWVISYFYTWNATVVASYIYCSRILYWSLNFLNFRYKRTQAEAHTLSLVQKELSHLDSLLSADVAILRDKIEESSREYLNAQ